jgi:hypothetical protein
MVQAWRTSLNPSRQKASNNPAGNEAETGANCIQFGKKSGNNMKQRASKIVDGERLAQSARGLAQSKTWRCFLALIVIASFPLLSALAQSYSVDWYKIAGGGGTSTGGTYQVSGTIGQADASGAMTGGNYSLTGGYWSLINVVQMPGVPYLLIVPSGPNSVKILWPDPATNSYTLQQNANLTSAAGWTTTGYAITNGLGTNFCTITPVAGNLFFRLKQ